MIGYNSVCIILKITHQDFAWYFLNGFSEFLQGIFPPHCHLVTVRSQVMLAQFEVEGRILGEDIGALTRRSGSVDLG